MKITKEQLKNIVRETLQEESEYQTFFKKALEKAGKSIPSMSDEEKKAFFNKIEKTWKGRGQKSEGNAFGAAVAQAKKDGDDTFKVGDKEYKTERFGRGQEGPTFGSEEESLDELSKAQEKLPPALKKAIEKKEKNESVVNEGNVKLPSSAKKFWNTPVEKLIKTYGSDLRNSIPPSQWNTHPEIIDGYGQNAGVDIFKQLVRDNLVSNDRLDPKLAKMIGIPTNVSIIDYLNDGGSGLNGNKYFKKYNNWFSALYDIYEEMEKKFGKKKPQSVGESVVNEGPSTEEKRIAMLAVRKQAKYRNVDLASAIQDQINALMDLQRDIKKGKIK